MSVRPMLPGSTIGILGGGQLGRMIGLEARRMGYDVVCLDPTPDSPCGQIAREQIVAPFDDVGAARRLGKASDLIVYEFENIPFPVVEMLEQEFRLPQGSRILRISQHRGREKTALAEAGFPVAPFRLVGDAAGLRRAVHELGLPCVLKTCAGGYDGKGQMVLNAPPDLEAAAAELDAGPPLTGEWIVEKFVFFLCEASVIVARQETGQTTTYPVGENAHRANVLHSTVVPARIDRALQAEAEALGEDIADALGLVGLMAIELFVTPGGLIVNELAPRPHNSGHYTWDASVTSQFEQLLRATGGLPLGSTRLLTPVVMINILGEHVPAVLSGMPCFPDNVKVHLYGKRGAPAARRKMGHLNVLGGDPDAVLHWADRLYQGRAI
ncbi:MAG TPA: 5-(carboxyamino)imidazole ribonucleotide synthase [Clostridiales bacterium]|nr:5-(carboxyamino)imidazole ribonucleotide synthase [Clostridiales bacterium]